METVVKSRSNKLVIGLLIAIVVLLAVIAVFQGIAPGGFVSQVGAKAKAEEEALLRPAKDDIRALSNAVEMFKLDTGSYPTTEQGLIALVERPASGATSNKWNGPYIGRIPKDPWGHEYRYEMSGGDFSFFQISSLGPGGITLITN